RQPGLAAERDVAAHVDREAGVIAQEGGGAVGGVSLGAAAEVEAQADRPADVPVRDLDLAPRAVGPRAGGPTRRRRLQRRPQVRRLDTDARGVVARALER